MLKGKIAVITGGSRGIGAAAARELAAMGVHIAVTYAGNAVAAQSVVEYCTAFGVKAQAWQCDVADAVAVKATVAAVKTEWGSIDILVNNAGITRDGLIAAMKQEAFDDVIRTNLGGAFNMIRQVSPIMIRNRWGRIINISSIAGLMGNAGQTNYAASKAGMIGLTKSVARELASRGITCNAVAPGFIRTDMTKNITEDNSMLTTIPLGHMGKPEDVAHTIAFLADSEYITGEVIRVDGGLAM